MVFTSQDAYNGCGGPGLYWKVSTGANSTLSASQKATPTVLKQPLPVTPAFPRPPAWRGLPDPRRSGPGKSKALSVRPPPGPTELKPRRAHRHRLQQRFGSEQAGVNLALGKNTKCRPQPNCEDIDIEMSATTGSRKDPSGGARKRNYGRARGQSKVGIQGKGGDIGKRSEYVSQEDRDLRSIAELAAQELKAALATHQPGPCTDDGGVNASTITNEATNITATNDVFDREDAEAWPVLVGSNTSTRSCSRGGVCAIDRVRANSWEFVLTGDDGAASRVAAVSAGAGGAVDGGVDGSAEAWEMVDDGESTGHEDQDEEMWLMTDTRLAAGYVLLICYHRQCKSLLSRHRPPTATQI
mmetsp:Transcript_25327/g.58926  ORF Transcript_25327/g.58926 Transcript_25327/m.58926 type:complete len:356 (-) Transcript_25327:1074-2141(-)